MATWVVADLAITEEAAANKLTWTSASGMGSTTPDVVQIYRSVDGAAYTDLVASLDETAVYWRDTDLNYDVVVGYRMRYYVASPLEYGSYCTPVTCIRYARTDTLTATTTETATIAETFGYTQTITATTTETASVTENVGFSDSMSATTSVLGDRTDDAGSEDEPSCTAIVSATLAEIQGFVEDIPTDISLTATVVDGIGFVESPTATATLTSSVYEDATVHLDYAYYLAGGSYNVFVYSEAYRNDDNHNMSCQWYSKTLDFSEMDNGLANKWKTVYAVDYSFVDLVANTRVCISVSTDGGLTWKDQVTQYVGTGTGGTGHQHFYFNETGQHFTFRVEWPSSDEYFQFLGLDIEFDVAGDRIGT